MENKLEHRMYGLVPYNISPIQQAIQYGHALQEMNNNIMSLHYKGIEEGLTSNEGSLYNSFIKWANEDKTFIILNGGTTNKRKLEKDIFKEGKSNIYFQGSLNNHLESLRCNNIKVASFCEPDLNDALTAIVFLVDERVWNREKYPDRIPSSSYITKEIIENNFSFNTPNFAKEEPIKEYENRLGGPTNVWLREFLKQFRLA